MSKPRALSSSELDALQLALPVGSANGTNVRRLETALGWNERKVRQGMQQLRRERHVPVVALTKPGGVFIATEADVKDLRRTYDSLHSRAMNNLVTCRELLLVIEDFEWSPTLFEQTA